jgi:hypothetical protein
MADPNPKKKYIIRYIINAAVIVVKKVIENLCILLYDLSPSLSILDFKNSSIPKADTAIKDVAIAFNIKAFKTLLLDNNTIFLLKINYFY